MKKSVIVLSALVAFLLSCQQNQKPPAKDDEGSKVPEWREPERLAYELKNAREWLLDSSKTSSEQEIVFAVNRTDRRHFMKMDSVIIPVDLSGDIVYYLPFPLELPYLRDIDKIVYFSYRTQTFAAYEKGILVYTGPTNMGREKDPTPTGLFFTNWKAEKTTSTFNDEWDLRWNFNIENKAGVGWHQYDLPGYPASHSCLRLLEKDAKYLYNWADQWVLENRTKVLVKGTPVIVFGTYDFHGPKPWLQLIHDPHALDISEEELEEVTEPFLNEIFMEQENREDYLLNNDQTDNS
jgi:hypothetical protein